MRSHVRKLVHAVSCQGTELITVLERCSVRLVDVVVLNQACHAFVFKVSSVVGRELSNSVFLEKIELREVIKVSHF